MMSILSPATQAEYEALITGAGVADLSQRDEIGLAGRDRASFLHNFCTADVKRLEPGQGSEAFFCNLQGKVLGHGYIFCDETALAVDTVAGQADVLIKHLDRYLIREDVELENRTAAVRKLLLAGRQAAELLQRLTGMPPPRENCAQASAQIGDVEVIMRRVDYAGPECFFLVCAESNVDQVRQGITDAGATLCRGEAVEIVRVEMGTPVYGRDISERNLPQELGRDDRAISFNKGCYLGQETVARIDALGHVNHRVIGLKFDSASPPEPRTPVSADGQPAGEVTSSVWSPRLAAPLALAYVRTAHANAGVQLDSPAGAATVVPLPVV